MAIASAPSAPPSSAGALPAADDAAGRCRFINERLPERTLYSDAKRPIHPESRASWRLSPEPFWLSPLQHTYLVQLGQDLLAFYRAINAVYGASVRGTQPTWVADYLDRGRPQQLVEYGRLNRQKRSLPGVIRPDLFLTEEGFVAAELDSVPGGVGFGASLARPYSELGFDLVGGPEGMVDGFDAMLASAAGQTDPAAGIVVSEESGDYWDEMAWLAAALRERGRSVHAVRPDAVRFTEDALLVPEGGSPGPRDEAEVPTDASYVPVQALYRFFELYDIKNIPKWELMLYSMKKQRVAVTPPVKSYLEEKLTFALLHHPTLERWWRAELKDAFDRLRRVIPPTWVLDPRPLPPHATIAGLDLGGRPVQDWAQLIGLTQKERQLVIKPSGFDATAWGSRGVKIGHDLPEDEWAAAVHEALERFDDVRYVLQKFHHSRRVVVQHYDFETGEVQRMPGRARLTPYYFVVGDEARLGGMTATVVPMDKKLIHGMVDAVIVPCAVRQTDQD
ncbi:MAG: hypothetical protein AVDCRST_MAG77-1543 [uncultured Chloroflexi bacterium]|uniref:Uncharacterized protein n=1 Tax=uncultured Chloroflexota bacterium TaxID=166587 RepID=A0A6J4I4U7_9CHLR|nr:MAG: hypothetical protein AVDCRST_MAG77-1543 [uncultured Chloroflexota bacterium]